jgi:hypothetical protein
MARLKQAPPWRVETTATPAYIAVSAVTSLFAKVRRRFAASLLTYPVMRRFRFVARRSNKPFANGDH